MSSPFLRQILLRVRRLTRGHAFLCIGALGLVARFFLAHYSLGSNDITTWAGFGRAIRTTSLGNVYDTVPLFNHPPLMGWMASLADALANRFHARFEVLFKTPVIVAECVAAILIHHCWQSRGAARAAFAFLLFAWNPASFLISAYHGNTDSLCATMSLLAAVLIQAERPFLGGLALAGGINVKLIAVLLVPVMLSCSRSWKQAFRIMGALLLGALPFLPFALLHWQGFRGHVLNYSSTPGYWGLTQLLSAFRESAGWSPIGTRLVNLYMAKGTLVVLAVPLLLAALNLRRKQRHSALLLAALVYCLFLVVTPGFGIQYIVYPTLLLFAVNLRHAVTYAWVAGLYAAVTYFALWTGTWPPYSDFNQPYPKASQALAYLLWLILLQITISLAGRLVRGTLRGLFQREPLRGPR